MSTITTITATTITDDEARELLTTAIGGRICLEVHDETGEARIHAWASHEQGSWHDGWDGYVLPLAADLPAVLAEVDGLIYDEDCRERLERRSAEDDWPLIGGADYGVWTDASDWYASTGTIWDGLDLPDSATIDQIREALEVERDSADGIHLWSVDDAAEVADRQRREARAERLDDAADAAWEASDEGGTIRPDAMLSLTSDPTRHTTTSLRQYLRDEGATEDEIDALIEARV
jgi:hypothetical protein